jgi:hypothetical protein
MKGFAFSPLTLSFRVMGEQFLDPDGGEKMSNACTYVKSLYR